MTTYQDMNGTVFTVEQFENCKHKDIIFCIDNSLYKLICDCGRYSGANMERQLIRCTKDYPWNPSEEVTLVEHIREYFYYGHGSVVYRAGISKEEIEKALFL